MNKKAISPLVATIILLAFAVAIGSVVMSWGQGLIEKATDQSGISLQQNCDALQKCYNNKAITKTEYDQINGLICS